MGRILAFFVLSTLCYLQKVNCDSQFSIESLRTGAIGGIYDVAVFAKPSKTGRFYYAFCSDDNQEKNVTVTCKVSEETLLSDGVSEKKTCEVVGLKSTHGVNYKTLQEVSDRKILITNEIIDGDTWMQLVNMANCDQHEIGLSSVQSFQVYPTNNKQFDVLWVGNKPEDPCANLLCRNTYNSTQGEIIVKDVKYSRMPKFARVYSRPWTVMLLGEQNKTSFYWEIIDEKTSALFKITTNNSTITELTKFNHKVKFYHTNDNQEFTICHLPYNAKVPSNYTCVRYDLDGNVKLNFSVTEAYFLQHRTPKIFLHNLKDNKLMAVHQEVTYEGTYYPKVFHSNGEYAQSQTFKFHESDLDCDYSEINFEPASTVIENNNEICLHLICKKYPSKLNMRIKCAEKSLFITSHGFKITQSTVVLLTSFFALFATYL